MFQFRVQWAVSGDAAGRAARGRGAAPAGRPRGTRRPRSSEPGRLQTSACAHRAADAAATASRTGRPPRVAGRAHRLGQARRLAVEHGPGAFGREVAGPEAGAAGRDDQPGEPGGQVAQRARRRRRRRRRLTRWSTTSKPASAQPGDERRPRLVVARARGDAVGDGQHLRRGGVIRIGADARQAPWARPPRGSAAAAASGSSAWKIALPATRMSAPAAAARGAVVDVDAAVDLDLDGQPARRRRRGARPRTLSSTSG